MKAGWEDSGDRQGRAAPPFAESGEKQKGYFGSMGKLAVDQSFHPPLRA